jgi:hypothetical protein
MEAFELINGVSPFLFIIRSLKYFLLTIRLEQASDGLAEIIWPEMLWLRTPYRAAKLLITVRQI